jgi:hypothetical protein
MKVPPRSWLAMAGRRSAGEANPMEGKIAFYTRWYGRALGERWADPGYKTRALLAAPQGEHGSCALPTRVPGTTHCGEA